MRQRFLAWTIAAATILGGLGLVAYSKAQPAENEVPDRAELRDRLAGLRAELAWLELEAETLTDRSALQEAIRSEQLLNQRAARIEAECRAELERKRQELDKEEFAEWIRGIMKEDSIQSRPGEDNEAAIIRSAIRLEIGDALDTLERDKTEFLRRTKNLEEKRLELADVERQYHEAR